MVGSPLVPTGGGSDEVASFLPAPSPVTRFAVSAPRAELHLHRRDDLSNAPVRLGTLKLRQEG